MAKNPFDGMLVVDTEIDTRGWHLDHPLGEPMTPDQIREAVRVLEEEPGSPLLQFLDEEERGPSHG